MSSLPCQSAYRSERCPPLSDSDSDVEAQNDDLTVACDSSEENQVKQLDCGYVDRSSAFGTRIESIEKLETNAEQLQHRIDEYIHEKERIQEEIRRKKKLLIDAIMKVVEFEISIQDVEAIIADKLHHFQTRVIDLESKRMEMFLNSGDAKVHELLEHEIEELVEEFNQTSRADECCRDEITQNAQEFAASIGDVIKEYQTYFEELLAEAENRKSYTQKEAMMNEFNDNMTQLRRLMNRPAQYCSDETGHRFFLDINKEKVFQVETHSSEYKLSSEGDCKKVKDGFKLNEDENGEFYEDLKGRKIYTKYYFHDDFGRFYIDVHGSRRYTGDPEASEYMLVNGNWKKVKSGTYETDERGLRVKPAEAEVLTDQQILDMTTEGLTEKMKDDDLNYIRESVGPAIRKALASVVLHQPVDPINYFAIFLLNYRYNQHMFEKRDEELKFFMDMREKLKKKEDEDGGGEE